MSLLSEIKGQIEVLKGEIETFSAVGGRHDVADGLFNWLIDTADAQVSILEWVVDLIEGEDD